MLSKLISILEEEAKNEKIVKIDKLFGKMTLDIICEVAFSFEMNALDNSELSEELEQAIKLFFEVIFF